MDEVRTDAREAEGSGLLSRPAGDRRAGSNPAPSVSGPGGFSGASGQREVGLVGNERRRSGPDHPAAYPLEDGRDPVDVAEEWVEVALQGKPWEARDSDGEEPCFIQRGTDRDGDCQHFIEAELSYLDACIIERLLEVARGEA